MFALSGRLGSSPSPRRCLVVPTRFLLAQSSSKTSEQGDGDFADLGSNSGLSRAARIEQLRKLSKEKMLAFEEKSRLSKRPKMPDPPPDAGHLYLQHLDSPIPKSIQGIADVLEDYIENTWLVFYPQGARLRKLQRDVAFRMDKPERPGKLPYESLLPLIGKMERAGKLRIRIGQSGRMVIYKPTHAQIEAEKLKAKIDQAIQPIEENAPSKQDEKEDPTEKHGFQKTMQERMRRGKRRKGRASTEDDDDEMFVDIFNDRSIRNS